MYGMRSTVMSPHFTGNKKTGSSLQDTVRDRDRARGRAEPEAEPDVAVGVKINLE